MKKLSFLFIILFLTSCGSVPFTGRRQLQLVSNDEVIALSLQQYQEFMRSAPLERGTADAQMVQRVGNRLARAVETFYRSNGYESEISNYAWEFNLVADKSVNAFAMPGGKVVVYSGLLRVTQTEEALAVVIGHEIAHVIAQHSNERISQQVALPSGAAIDAGLLRHSDPARQLGNTVYGIEAQHAVMMPHERQQNIDSNEIEAIIMPIA